MRLRSLVLSSLSLCTVRAQYASTYPAPIPLFHKSPYLNGFIYADANVTSTPETRWSKFFSGSDLGWFLGLRVDGSPYLIQGIRENYTSANTIGAYITPTRTIFTIDAGPVRVNISYLTPIELLDWTRHSLPFIYLAVDLWSTDGASHNLQFYTDNTGEFVSSNWLNKIMWNTVQTNQLVYHVMNQTTRRPPTENSDMSEDGSLYFAYTSIPGVSLTWQIADRMIRTNFFTAGNLTNTTDPNFRAINNSWPVSAFALDFGNIIQTTTPLVFAVGLVRDPVVVYQTPNGLESRSQLWQKKWSDVGSAIGDFLSGYSESLSRATAFDNSIVSATSAISSKFNMTSSATTQLTDLAILSLRQTIGSLEFTASQLSDQGMDDLRVFMKDVGTSRYVNPVEMIYASFPAFLYLNATLAGQLLLPLLEFESSVSYNLDYAAPDLGSSWPKVLGKNTGSGSVDSSGSMLVMALAQARKSGDGKLLFTYYDVFRKWADFLTTSTKSTGFPPADGLLGATSNLMLNGIMGIYAMGQINKVLEAVGADSSLTSHYLDTARSFAQKWKESVLDSDWHPYGNNASWGLLYNLYAPRLLGADIIPEQIYELQAGWCSNQSAKVQSTQPYGLSYEGNQSVTVKAHWTLLTAGSIVNSTISDARDALLSTVHARSFMKTGQNANPSTYSAIDGSLINGTASPAMGAAFAFLALGLPDLAIKLPSGSLKSSTTSRATKRVPAIVGGVLGSIAVILLVFLYLRQRRGKVEEDQDFPVTPFTSEFNHEESESDQPEDAPRLVSSPVRQPQKLIPHRSKYLPSIRIKNHAKVDLESSSSVAGSSTRTPAQDDDLRREVEQLRIVVEALREEQVAPPQFVDQDVPNEPPPGYGTLTQ